MRYDVMVENLWGLFADKTSPCILAAVDRSVFDLLPEDEIIVHVLLEYWEKYHPYAEVKHEGWHRYVIGDLDGDVIDGRVHNQKLYKYRSEAIHEFRQLATQREWTVFRDSSEWCGFLTDYLKEYEPNSAWAQSAEHARPLFSPYDEDKGIVEVPRYKVAR